LAAGYDSETDAWDEPLKRRNRPASQHIRSSMQRPTSPYSDKPSQAANQGLIHLPYCRDPSQPVKKLPPEEKVKSGHYDGYTPTPYNRQGYGSIKQQAWNEYESRPGLYKKKQAPSTPLKGTPVNKRPAPAPRTTAPAIPQTEENWQASGRTSLRKVDKNKNVYGGSIPNDMNNPIRELQELAKQRSFETVGDDDPPFNFQAMLRKTPRNRESMKRTGEAPLSLPPDINYSPISLPLISDKSSPSHGKGKAPSRPKSTHDFKRKDSVERFKLALKKTDSSQSLKTGLNGNLGEIIELAPGITIEGYVSDL
jgi:myosin III